MRTIRDIELSGETVLVRVDYNLPLADGKVGDTQRIEASLPTLRYLLQQRCRLVLISHLGRPEGRVVAKLSLRPLAEVLKRLLGREVQFMGECVGREVEQAVRDLSPGDVLLLENLRFHPGEEANDSGFAAQLARLGEVLVQDGFAVVHRAHASTAAITKLLPSVAGLLVEREVKALTGVLETPQHPFLAVIGGAKVSTKIEVLRNLLSRVDRLMIGGAMANTFLKAQGIGIGKSIYEPEAVELAGDILEQARAARVDVMLPQDVVVAAEISATAASRECKVADVKDHELILDVGPATVAATFAKGWQPALVLWNGPIGYTEFAAFAEGSQRLTAAIIESGARSIVGGGDTASFVDQYGLQQKFSFVSTGGGATLEFLAGKELPGLAALA